MKRLDTLHDSRDALAEYLRDAFADILARDDSAISPYEGGQKAADTRLKAMDPVAYVRSRNFYDGAVTRLSPYLRHGILHQETVRQAAIAQAPPKTIEKFIQEVAWRSFWQRVYRQHPEWIWEDVEDYKTGFTPNQYAEDLPDDIARGETGTACIDHFIRDLLRTGYMHNHTRMYVASYVVHFRQVKWQAGARWFLQHLIDGDPASNNFSWQWVASTFANKPYIFNLENIDKYCGNQVDCSPANNVLLDATYPELEARLFPAKVS